MRHTNPIFVTLLSYSKSQRIGIILLFSLIILCQSFYVSHDFKAEGLNAEELELELIDAGLEELGESTGENGEEVLVLRCGFTDFGNMQKALEDRSITPLSAELEWIPTVTVPVSDEQAEEVSKLIEKLEQDDDVQKVFHNMA